MQLDMFQSTRAVAFLRGLTGNIDTSGGDVLPQPVPVRNIQAQSSLPAHVEPITADYPLFNTFHETWGKQVQSCVVDSILDEKPYPLKMVVVQSGNPVVTMADSTRALKAFKKLDFLVVIDLFMTKTGELADVILPASSCFEKTQINRSSIRNNPVILQDQVIEPMGDSKPDWQIVFELGRRLGYTVEFPWQTAEAAIDYQLEPSGITVDQLRQNPGGVRVEDIAYTKYREKGFNTPSGKFEFYSEKLAQNGFPGVPYAEGFLENPISFSDRKDAYPIYGISGARDNRFTNSQYRMIPALLNNEYGCVVDIHPKDAESMGIETGDEVMIETPRGAIRMKAKIGDVVHPGAVRIAWGWGDYNAKYNLNSLTDDERRNPITGTPSQRSFMCRITKL
jgi:anaerobic selenocysteine-containing dehydrogenase